MGLPKKHSLRNRGMQMGPPTWTSNLSMPRTRKNMLQWLILMFENKSSKICLSRREKHSIWIHISFVEKKVNPSHIIKINYIVYIHIQNPKSTTNQVENAFHFQHPIWWTLAILKSLRCASKLWHNILEVDMVWNN
jgi:hypothetical protein